MKLTHKKLKPGMTLIELTVVIIVLLTLISVLFFAGTAYIQASNRTACLTNQATIQKAMRGYSTLNQLNTAADAIPNTATAPADNSVAAVDGATINWTTIKTAGFIGGLPSTMKCPTDKTSGYTAATAVPKIGELVAKCPNLTKVPDHVASDITNY